MSTITERLEAATSEHERAAQRMHDLLDAMHDLAGQWITGNLTITIGSNPDDDYETIPEAMAWLATRPIARGAIVTLSLRAEQHVYNGDSVVISHPDADRIRLVGAPLSGADPVEGDFAVTGHGSSARAANAATNLAMLRGKYASELRFTGGAQLVIRDGLALIDDLLVTSDGTSAACVDVFSGTLIVGTLSVHGASEANIRCRGNSIAMLEAVLTSTASGLHGVLVTDPAAFISITSPVICAGNAGHGITSTIGATVNMNRLVSRGNGQSGAFSQAAASVRIGGGGFMLNGNAASGVHCQAGASFVAVSGGEMNGNGADGCRAERNSLISLSTATSASDNTEAGLRAMHGGMIIANSAVTGGNGTFAVHATDGSYIGNAGGSGTASPAVNTSGNNNSYIRR